jgi:hypothetical protein
MTDKNMLSIDPDEEVIWASKFIEVKKVLQTKYLDYGIYKMLRLDFTKFTLFLY